MRRLRGYLRLILLLPLLITAPVFASESHPGVMIVEVQTTGSGNATNEEFVEIYNPTQNTIDVSTWKLQYLSAAGSSWQTKATLNGYIYPSGRLLIAANDYLVDDADITYTPGLKLEAGHVRIVSPNTQDESQIVVEDLVGWGTALHSEGNDPAIFASAGSSIVRRQDANGDYIDSDNNKNDFEISSQPTPESDNIPPETVNNPDPASEPTGTTETTDQDSTDTPTLPSDTEQVIPSPESTDTIDEQNTDNLLQPIQITELLPNPAPPASDSSDEYIELYNPNDQQLNLDGYKLQTGNAFTYSYALSSETIGPHSYLTLYISETGLTLANSSGQARLLNPDGVVVSQTGSYDNAKDGQTWSLVDGVWQWNTNPTPGMANVFIAPSTITSTKTTTKKTKVKKKKQTSKKKATKAKKTAKKKAAKKKKSGQVAGATSDSNSSDGESSTMSVNKWVIAGVGSLAVGYALYEYKDDIRNLYLKLKRDRAFSRTPRTTP